MSPTTPAQTVAAPIQTIDTIAIVKGLILLKKVKQAELSAQSGISQSNISGWLKGMANIISENREVLLLNALGIRRDRLDNSVIHEWEITESMLRTSNDEAKYQLKTVFQYVFGGTFGRAEPQVHLYSQTPHATSGLVGVSEAGKTAMVRITAPDPLIKLFDDFGITLTTVVDNFSIDKPIKQEASTKIWTSEIQAAINEINDLALKYNTEYFADNLTISTIISKYLNLPKVIEITTEEEVETIYLNGQEESEKLNKLINQLVAVRDARNDLASRAQGIAKMFHKEQLLNMLEALNVPTDKDKSKEDKKRELEKLKGRRV